MTNFPNTTPTNNLYAVNSATTTTNAFVDVFRNDRNPNEFDVNYPIQKKWFNTTTGEFWMLEGFESNQGAVFAIWVKFAAVNHIEFLQGNTGPVVPPDSLNVIHVVGDGNYITTNGTPLNNTVTISPTGAIPVVFNEDTGSASAMGGIVNFAGTTGTFGVGSGIRTHGFGNSVSFALNSPYILSDFEFLANTPNTPRFLQIFNQSNTSGANAALQIAIGGTSGGDPYIELLASNNKSAVIGYLNAANEFTIGAGPNGTTPQTASQYILLRPANPDLLFQLPAVTQNTNSATGALFTIQDTNNVAGATSQINLIAGSSDSDSWIAFNDFITTDIYHVGKEGNSQIFKIGFGASSLTGSTAIMAYLPVNKITTFQNANVTMPDTSCVIATKLNTSLNLTGDGTTVTVIFDNVLVDQDTNYNSTTGVFTAPVSGNYLVSASVTFDNIGATNIDGNSLIIANSIPFSQNLGNVSAVCDTSGQYTATITRVCNFGSGDTTSIQARIAGGTQTVGIVGSPGNYSTQLSIQLLC